jgi:hypothetical protein
MSVVDFLLNSLIKHLQKTQKARKKRKKAKRRFLKKVRKSAQGRSRPQKRKVLLRRRRSRKRPAPKRPTKRLFGRKKLRAKKRKAQSFLKKRKAVVRPIARPRTVKKIEKPTAKVPERKDFPREVCIGEITHFFSRIQVVVIKMTKGRLSVGDEIHIMGRGTDFTQKVESLQIESIDVKTAHQGQLVGLKVKKATKVGSKVYK